MKCIAIITARSGSKGLPNKNVKELGGIPLLGWITNAAKNSRLLDKVIMSTDSEMYFEKGKKIYEELIFHKRTVELAEDVPSELVIEDVIKKFKNIFNKDSIIVLLQPTTPFTEGKDIDNCIQRLIEKSEFNTIVSVKHVSEYPEWIINGESDYYGSCKNISGENSIRQNFKIRWIPNGGIWAFRKSFFEKERKIIDEKKTLIYEMSKIKSLDIDEKDDFILCQAVVNAKIISIDKR